MANIPKIFTENKFTQYNKNTSNKKSIDTNLNKPLSSIVSPMMTTPVLPKVTAKTTTTPISSETLNKPYTKKEMVFPVGEGLSNVTEVLPGPRKSTVEAIKRGEEIKVVPPTTPELSLKKSQLTPAKQIVTGINPKTGEPYDLSRLPAAPIDISTAIKSKNIKEIPIVNTVSSIINSLKEQYTKPSENILKSEKLLGLSGIEKPKTTFEKVSNIISEPLRTLGKGVVRTLGVGLEPLGTDIGEYIASYEINKKVASGELPSEVLDQLDILKKTNSQVAGDIALAVLTAYAPDILGKTAINVSGKPIVSAMSTGLLKSLPMGAGMAGSQILQSGTSDIEEIKNIVATNIGTMGILGMITSGIIPVSQKVFNDSIKIKSEIKTKALKNGYSEIEAERIANNGGYIGNVPKKNKAQEKLPEITTKTTLPKQEPISYSFVSPNIKEGLSFEQAKVELNTDRHLAIKNEIKKINNEITSDFETIDALGDWSDGAENTLVTKFKTLDNFEKLRYNTARAGLIANQKAVIPFMRMVGGKDSLFVINFGEISENNIKKILDENNLQFRTFSKEGVDNIIYIFDENSKLTNNIINIEKYVKDISKYQGRGEFLGSWETREEGASIYKKVIEDFKNKGLNQRQGVSEVVDNRNLNIEQKTLTDPLKILQDQIKKQKYAYARQEALRTQERGKRVASLEKIGKELSGEEARIAQRGALKGKLPEISVKSIREEVGLDKVNEWNNQIENSPSLTTYAKVNAKEGLRRLLDGDLIVPSQRRELVKVLPERIIKTMEKINDGISDVDKVLIKIRKITPNVIIDEIRSSIDNYNDQTKAINRWRKEIPQLTGNQELYIINKVKEIQSTVSDIDKVRKFGELSNYAKSIIPSSLYDKVISVWKAGLLTGIKTTGLNIGSNIMHAGLELTSDIPASVADSLISVATGKRSVSLTGRGLTTGVTTGVKKGWDFLSTGFDERNVLEKLDYKKINMGKNKMSNGLQTYVDTVFRLMGAEDQPFYYGAYSHSLYNQAITKAKNAGYHVLKRGREDFIKDLIKNPTNDMVTAATQDALTAVFQNNSSLAKIVSYAQRTPYVGQIVIPFGKTPANVAMAVVNYTPVGAIKEVAKQIKNKKLDQRQLSKAIGRSATGIGILWVGTQLAKQGLITTDRPTGEKELKQWELEGKNPNSFYDSVANKWRSIGVLGPAGNLLVIGAQYQNKLDETGSPAKAMLGAVTGGAKSFSEQTFLKGVNQFSEAFSDLERFGPKLASNLAGSLIPTIVSDISRATDIKDGKVQERLANTFTEKIKSRLPVLRKELEPRVNVFGEEVRTQNPIETMIDPSRPSTAVSTPLIDELKRLYRVGKPVTPTSLGDKEGYKYLTPKQNTDLWKYDGETIKILLEKLIDSNDVSSDFGLDEDKFGNVPYSELSDDQKSRAISNITDKGKDYTRAMMVIELTKGLSGDELLKKLGEYKEGGLLTNDVYDKYVELKESE